MANPDLCSIPDCSNPVRGHGWCNKHLLRWQRHGDPLGGAALFRSRQTGPCSIDGCDLPASRRGWCDRHYGRWQRHGDPLGGIAAPTPIGEPMRFFHEVVLPHTGDECLIWPFVRSGDGSAQIWLDGTMRQVSVLACESVNGPAPSPDHEAAHNCGKRHLGCVAPLHLRWATHADNMADRLVHGTHLFGEVHGMAKLTEADVLTIRSLRGLVSQRQIARDFGVTHCTVGSIQRRKTWKHLT